MRKVWLIFILLALSPALSAQSLRKIKEDPSLIWGEGRGTDYESIQSAALDALVSKLASTDLIDVPERSKLSVWKTYRGDILSVSEVVMESGTALRFIPWKDVDRVFSRRRGLVSELRSNGVRALSEGRKEVASACAVWALALLDVLPGNHDMKASLEALASSAGPQPQTSVPGLSYVGREVGSIRLALGKKELKERKDVVEKPLTSGKSAAVTDPEPFVRPSMETLPGINNGMPSKMAEYGSLNGIAKPSAISAPFAVSESPSAKPSMNYLLLAQASAFPALEAGLFIGLKRNTLGGYLSARTGFGAMRHDYSASSDGRTDFGFLWASGKKGSSRYSVSGGALFGLGRSAMLYAGAGYGRIDCLWKDTSGQWARIEDLSHRGTLLEAGLVYSFGPISIQAGASSIFFTTFSPVFGLGFNF